MTEHLTPGHLSIFEAMDVAQRRYVWDQLVHGWYGERCVLIVLTLPEIEGSTRQRIQAIADGLGLASTSVYVVYGYYDIFIRTWVTPGEQIELLARLRAELKSAEVEVFDVADIDYSRWSDKGRIADPADIVRLQAQIVRLARNDEDQEAAQRLSDAGLIHLYDPARELGADAEAIQDFYKVYLILRRTRVDAPELDSARLNRLEPVLGTLDFLAMPTVYYGTGRTIDCVIKGLVSPVHLGALYASVLDLKDRLLAADLRLRPMTLILAKAGEIERDRIRTDIEGPEDQTVRHLRSYLSDQANDEWPAIKADLRSAVVQIFKENWMAAAQGPFIRHFLDLIEGAILADQYKINGAASFAFDLEIEVRDAIVKKLFPSALGNREWRAKVLEFLVAAEESFQESLATGDGSNQEQVRTERNRVARLADTVRTRVDSIALGESVHLVRRLVDGGVIDKGAADAVLGESWFERYQAAIDFRNNFAHGRLHFSSGEVDPKWWTSVAREVLAAGTLLGQLQTEEVSK